MIKFIKIFLISVLTLIPGVSTAKNFPNRAVRLIVPFPAGGSTDLHLRMFANLASKHLGQPFIIENKPGASGSVALSYLKNEKPDGYTLSVVVPTSLRLPHLIKTNYDPIKDFTYISMLSGYSYVVAVPMESQFKNWGQVVEYAKANPGGVSYGMAGTNSTMHLVMEQVSEIEGITLTPIPYKGDGDQMQDVSGNQVDMALPSLGGAAPMVDAGRVRMLAVFTGERASRFPDVPTMQEAGTDMVADVPYGLVGPAGMSQQVIDALADAFEKAAAEPENKAFLETLGQVEAFRGPEQYREWAEQTYNKERELISAINKTEKD